MKLQRPEKDHGNITFEVSLKRGFGIHQWKKIIIIIKGRERGRQAEGREKAKGGRWEAKCYIPVYITQVCGKRRVMS